MYGYVQTAQSVHCYFVRTSLLATPLELVIGPVTTLPGDLVLLIGIGTAAVTCSSGRPGPSATRVLLIRSLAVLLLDEKPLVVVR